MTACSVATRYAPFLVTPVVAGVFATSCGNGGPSVESVVDAGSPDARTAAAAPLVGRRARALRGERAPSVPRVPVAAELVPAPPHHVTVNVQEMMFSAGEMQISGEPFAEFFGGRNLNYYDRAFLPPDRYLIPVSRDAGIFDFPFSA